MLPMLYDGPFICRLLAGDCMSKDIRSRIAAVIAKKCKKCRRLRKLPGHVAAQQLGISLRAYESLENGNFVPARWLQLRILAWLAYETTFTKDSPKEGRLLLKAPDSETITITVPSTMKARVANCAARIGLKQHEFVVFAVATALDNPKFLAEVEPISKALQKAALVQLLQEVPECVAFCSLEVKKLERMGTKFVDSKPPMHVQSKEALGTLYGPLDALGAWEVDDD